MGLTGSRSRWVAFFALSFALLFMLAVAPSFAPVYGQEGDNTEKTKTEDKAAANQGSPNLFWHIVKSAGIVFGPLLLLVSIGLVALIVLLAMDLRMGVAIPPGFV